MVRARRPQGFTLIEAMVVVAVVAVLVSLALPTFGSRLTHHRLVAAAQGLAQDMAEARFQATQDARSLHIVFSGSGADWCYAVARSPGCDCRSPGPCQIKVVDAREWGGIRLEQPRSMAFDPAPAAVVAGGAEFGSAAGERLQVSLTPMGRARICALSATAGFGAC